MYKVPFSGSGGFRSVETGGNNLRRQWNAALHAQFMLGGNNGFFDFINGL